MKQHKMIHPLAEDGSSMVIRQICRWMDAQSPFMFLTSPALPADPPLWHNDQDSSVHRLAAYTVCICPQSASVFCMLSMNHSSFATTETSLSDVNRDGLCFMLRSDFAVPDPLVEEALFIVQRHFPSLLFVL